MLAYTFAQGVRDSNPVNNKYTPLERKTIYANIYDTAPLTKRAQFLRAVLSISFSRSDMKWLVGGYRVHVYSI